MTTFLTTQDVQDLLHVDRSTVYRMAEDGRLPGVKVGRQWRFPSDRMADQLGVDPLAPTDPTESESTPVLHLTALVDHDTFHTIAELLADLYGVMAVVTDMDGNPMTTVVNPCGFYDAISQQPGAAEFCVDEWRSFAIRTQITPTFVPSHLGFLCARTFTWVDRHAVGMLLIGGITPPDWPPPPDRINHLADTLGVPRATVESAIDQTYDVSRERQRWMLHTLPQVGDLVSQLLAAQNRMVSKLDAIAHLACPPQIGTAS